MGRHNCQRLFMSTVQRDLVINYFKLYYKEIQKDGIGIVIRMDGIGIGFK